MLRLNSEESKNYIILFNNYDEEEDLDSVDYCIVLNSDFNNGLNYFKSDKNLTVQWIPCDEFIAYADIDELGGNNYSINISYGVPISLYIEASTFLRMCTIEYKKSQYDILFNTFDYGEGRENIFPKELTGDSLKLLFFNYSFLWIYYHEQSHILQQHANISLH